MESANLPALLWASVPQLSELDLQWDYTGMQWSNMQLHSTQLGLLDSQRTAAGPVQFTTINTI